MPIQKPNDPKATPAAKPERKAWKKKTPVEVVLEQADKLKYDFRLCYIPPTVTPCESFTFDQPKMLALYNAGKTWGQNLGNQSKWMSIPSVDEGASVKQ